jgi:nicotinamidase/pyrazinamidase
VLFAEDVARDERFAHRFIEEARIAARIEHPGAVRVIDFDRDDESGCYYLVMELVRGVTLMEILRDQGFLAQDMILDIAERVSEVLLVASGFGIVHRDISPANILITETGVVKLADLGIAKFIDDPRSRDLVDARHGREPPSQGTDAELVEALHSVPMRTATGVLLGTPLYISPEQSRDARLADFRCDMYSLGATLFHAAAGHPPFSGLTIGDVVLQHRETPPPDLCKERPAIAPELARLIARLLEKEPARRFPSFERLIEDIRACRRVISERAIVHGLVGKGWRGRMMRWLGLRTRRFHQEI